MNEEKLLKEYLQLNPNLKKLYVVPLLNQKNKNTEYIYLLFKKFIEDKNCKFKVDHVSVFAHYKFVLKKLLGENNLVHYHWFEATDFKSLIGIFWKTFWLTVYKISGGKIVWTIHNKYPHVKKYKSLNKLFRKYLARIANRLHVHCRSAVKIMAPILSVPTDKFFIVDHPDYPVKIIDRLQALKIFKQKYPSIIIHPNKKIFLSLGAIAEYKGLLELLTIFKEIENVTLIIAGVVKKGSEKYFSNLTKQAEGNDNIIILAKFISESEINIFYGISDFVIFNFDEILTSGSVILALNHNTKVIAPAMGCLNDIKNRNLILFEKKNNLSNLNEVLKNLLIE